MSAQGPAAASQPVNVSILDREYLVACEPHEKTPLVEAAALTLAHEFLELSANARVSDGSLSENVASLQRKLDGALAHFIQ